MPCKTSEASLFKVGGQRLENRQIVAIAAGSNHNIVALATQLDEDEEDSKEEKEKKEAAPTYNNDTPMKD